MLPAAGALAGYDTKGRLMDALTKLPREVQALLGCAALYFILSFLDWQSASIGPYTIGVSEWHGFGILGALLAIALLIWEGLRLTGRQIDVGTASPGLVSLALAEALLVVTVIIFLDWSDYRAWPEWLGLVLSIVIGVLAFRRAKAEGVEIPSLPKARGGSGGTA